ncbi:MAG: NADH-quinone oxidoreductase subunit H, partial [Muribaculaceae bacterium]|nr:NADH-quinone oxidoreductase subunit H [Muribaculaceae bacterium]
MFDFGKWTSAFNDLLLGTGMADWLAVLIECVIIAVLILGVYTVLALFYILYERKLCAWFQCRLGPMRVGRWGLLQVFADMFKILIKELISLKGTDRFLFKLAPYLIITSSVVMLACLPWGNGLQIIDWNIGIFFVLAVSSVGVLG